MKKAAVVLSVRGGKAVVLVNGGDYLLVKDQGWRVGQQIQIEAGERTGKHPLRRLFLIAACVTMMVASSGLAVSKYVPWTYVSMDSENYSVEISLNALGEVLDMQSLSEDGATIQFHRFENGRAVEERMLKACGDEKVLVGVADRFGNTKGPAEHFKSADGITCRVEVREVSWENAGKARQARTSLGRWDYVRENVRPENDTDADKYYRMPFDQLTEGLPQGGFGPGMPGKKGSDGQTGPNGKTPNGQMTPGEQESSGGQMNPDGQTGPNAQMGPEGRHTAPTAPPLLPDGQDI